MAVVLGVVVLAAGWLAFRGLQAKTELEAAVAASERLTAAVGDADLGASQDAIDALASHSAAAASVASDPVWRAAELVPVLGPNLTAVRVAATQVHALTVDVAEPLLSLSRTLVADDGSTGSLLNVEALADGAAPLRKADAALRTADAELAGIRTASLLQPVADGVSQLTEVVDTARPAVAALTDASAVVPSMLGAYGPRTLLVMLQNSAEVRTGGGITGTFIEVRADHGALEITGQADSSDFTHRSTPIAAVPASTTALYGDVIGRYVQDASVTPDYHLTATLASAWWHERTGHTPDAVISIDPLVLKAVLTAIGPVATPQGDITADNVVKRLLVDPYRSLSQDAQTAVFEDAATAVFTALTKGGADPVALAGALIEPVEEGRVSVWSAHDDEQEVLARTLLAGPAARQRAAGADAYAVYLNDVTGGKMGTYLETAISSGTATCRPDGKSTVDVTITLTSTAPKNAANLPESLTGGGHYGVPAGHIGTTVAVSAPHGAFIGGVTVDGDRVVSVDENDEGFQVSAYTVDLKPGETKTIVFRFYRADASHGTPTVLHTPLVSDPAVTVADVVCT